MKKDKKFLITLSAAFILVIVSSTLLGYGFASMQNKEEEYTAVTVTTDSTEPPDKTNETNTPSTEQKPTFTKPETTETFEVQGITFAVVDTPAKPTKKDLTAKQMAELVIKEHDHYFPEKKLEGTIYMTYFNSSWHMIKNYSEELQFLLKNSQNVPGRTLQTQAGMSTFSAAANSVTGNIREMFHPNLPTSLKEKWISNEYFSELVGNKIQSRGRDLIREYDLVDSEPVIENLTTGYNVCQYGLIAVGCEYGDGKRAAVYMDMKTQEFVGFMKNNESME